MKKSMTEKEDARVFLLEGEIGVVEAKALKADFLECVEKDQKGIVVDLSQVNFIASAGIGLFAVLQKTCNEKGIRLAFVKPPSLVLNVFRITQLIDMFEIHENEETALRSVEARVV